jgi:hypothetical protein
MAQRPIATSQSPAFSVVTLVQTLAPNWAALDQVDAKAATIAAKHYGSRDARLEAAKKRNDIRELVASKLAHEVMPK